MRRVVFLIALPLIGIAGFATPFVLPEAKAAPELSRRAAPAPEAAELERASELGRPVAALISAGFDPRSR